MKNLGDVNDDHYDRFLQDISVMEQRFKREWNPGMLADYCWGIKSEDHTPHTRLRRTRVVGQENDFVKSLYSLTLFEAHFLHSLGALSACENLF